MNDEQVLAALFELIKYNYDIEQMIDRCAKLLGLPMWLMDEDFNVIAMSKKPSCEIYFQLYSSDQDRNIFDWMSSGFTQKMEDSTMPVVRYDELLKVHVIAANVLVENERVARLSIFDAENKYKDYFVVKLITDAIAIQLERNTPSIGEKDVSKKLLRSLVNDKEVDQFLLNRFLKQYAYTNQTEYQIGILQMDKRNKSAVSYLNSNLPNMYPNIKCIQSGMNLIILSANGTDIPRCLKEYLKQSNTRLGISKRFTKLEAFKSFYSQALFALEQDNAVTFYEDVQVEEMIEILSTKRDVMSFCDERVVKIIEYDRTYQTSYIDTLQMLIQTDTYSEAAEKLDIHENTIKYRVKKIKELFGIDLSSHDDLIRTAISLKIIQLYLK